MSYDAVDKARDDHDMFFNTWIAGSLLGAPVAFLGWLIYDVSWQRAIANWCAIFAAWGLGVLLSWFQLRQTIKKHTPE